MLPLYYQMLQAGGLKMVARPTVVKENAATAVIDADAALGHIAAVKAMNLAIKKCAAIGIGAVTVFNSHHFGAAGLYAEMAARRGMVALVTSSARTVAVIPTGGAMPLLGTNPIAFAAPGRKHEPFLLDMSTSAVAANKIKVYSYHGTPLPAGWVVDGAGNNVTDPHKGFRLCMDGGAGGLMPLGGSRETGTHKGYGLAVMAQLLGSTLGGGSFSPFRIRDAQPGEPDNIGHFFLALDPKQFRTGGTYEEDVDAIIDALKDTKPIDADAPVIVAGEPEFTIRAERLACGIPLNKAFLAAVRKVAIDSGVEFFLTDEE
jgi:LDH2 family malate/lactate/ureidoglycolate dehydrogenase